MPKLVEDTTAKEEAARQKQRADELEKKAKDEEQKRLAAEAAAGRAAGPPAAASVPKATNTSPAALAGASALPTLTATKDNPFTNSLGMKFVPVPINAGPSKGQRILFSIWETRSKDYAAFISEVMSGKYDSRPLIRPSSGAMYTLSFGINNVKNLKRKIDTRWKDSSYEGVPVGRGEGESADQSNHPVTCVSAYTAEAFCDWLTKKELASGLIGPQDEYRLPSDVEWSYAVGIGDLEDASASREDKDMKIDGVYPWGTTVPPPAGSGNYADTTAMA